MVKIEEVITPDKDNAFTVGKTGNAVSLRNLDPIYTLLWQDL